MTVHTFFFYFTFTLDRHTHTISAKIITGHYNTETHVLYSLPLSFIYVHEAAAAAAASVPCESVFVTAPETGP